MDYFSKSAPPLETDKSDTPEGRDIGRLANWLDDELIAISAALQEMNELRMSMVSVAPKKLRDGVVVYADGTTWNPGSGKGLYEYRNGAWFKL